MPRACLSSSTKGTLLFAIVVALGTEAPALAFLVAHHATKQMHAQPVMARAIRWMPDADRRAADHMRIDRHHVVERPAALAPRGRGRRAPLEERNGAVGLIGRQLDELLARHLLDCLGPPPDVA